MMVHTTSAIVFTAVAISVTSTLAAPVTRGFNKHDAQEDTRLFARGNRCSGCMGGQKVPEQSPHIKEWQPWFDQAAHDILWNNPPPSPAHHDQASVGPPLIMSPLANKVVLAKTTALDLYSKSTGKQAKSAEQGHGDVRAASAEQRRVEAASSEQSRAGAASAGHRRVEQSRVDAEEQNRLRKGKSVVQVPPEITRSQLDPAHPSYLTRAALAAWGAVPIERDGASSSRVWNGPA